MYCPSCYCAAPSSATPFCSKRCLWFGSCCCPQCGRGRPPTQVFCSYQCAGESMHANWCPCCGVRQLQFGYSSCGAEHCARAIASMQQAPTIPNRNANRATAHTRLSVDDKALGSIRQQLKGCSITGILKLGGSIDAKKRYMAYRLAVENDLGSGATKYGNGGEGNEQRRFVALSRDCDVSSDCHSPTCQACTFLRCGVNSLFTSTPEGQRCASSLLRTWSTCQSALDAVDGAAAVIVVCRVVVGRPALSGTGPAAGEHSVAVSFSDRGCDAVTVFDPVAVDAAFAVTVAKELA